MKALKSVNKYFLKYKWHLGLGVLFIFLSNYFGVKSPQVIRQAIDTVITKAANVNTPDKLSDWRLSSFNKEILYLSLLAIFFAILRGFFLYCMRQTIIVMSRHIEYDQKNELFNHYQQLDIDFYKKNNTGDLMTRITEDVSKVRMYTGPGIMYTLNLIALSILVIYHMWHVAPVLTLYSMFPLPIMLVTIFFVNGIIEKKSERIQAQLSELNVTAQETYSGIRVIKAFVQELNFINRFQKDSDKFRKNSMRLVRVEAIYFPIIFVLVGLSTVMTIYIGGKQVIAGTITPGVIAEFLIYINMVTWPFAAVGWVTALIQRAGVSQKRIDEFLLIEPKIKEGTINKKINGTIELNDVSYTYPNTGIKALKNISFKVNQGERMAIVGRTGSGKTTIAALITRMIDADKGEVLVDNENVKKYSFSALRNQIGYVPQDVFLFSESISNNIQFGIDELNEKLVHEAAHHASFTNEAKQLPHQFDTIIGERGITLSGGQKQRVSIARSLIKDSPIVIFDDCLSAVDANTEQIILNNLNNVITGKTTLLITHRIFSLINFNKIVVIDEGAIAESGTHEELMNLRGLYFNIYELQRREDENKSEVL